MSDPAIDAAVVGGGVVGLAAACAVAARGRTTCVERLPRPGLEASTHNSGVAIRHLLPAGFTVLCVEGRERLYALRGPRRAVRALRQADRRRADRMGARSAVTRGHANGVTDLELVDRAFVRRREPHVEAAAAIWSPSSGIVEAEARVRALARVAAAREVALRPAPASPVSPVPTAWRSGPRARRSSPAPWSTRRASTPTTSPPRSAARPSRSTRSGATTPSWCRRRGIWCTAYPLPDPSGHGLGVHLPEPRGAPWDSTARYQARKDDYESDREPLATFHAAARRLLPGLELNQLRPGGSGIRARGAPAERTFSDFLIRRDRRQPRLVQAAGIDSPGLTASLAIAERVADLVDETLA